MTIVCRKLCSWLDPLHPSATRASSELQIDIYVDNTHIELSLWDTAGQEEFDRLRSLSYSDTHTIMLCFSVCRTCPSLAVTAMENTDVVRHGCARLIPGIPWRTLNQSGWGKLPTTVRE